MKKILYNIKGSMKTLLYSLAIVGSTFTATASSHREAPLIADDPLADNTDLYVFRSPGTPEIQETITIIANFIPLELPHGGPNYYTFGENIRYEIHIDNNIATLGDDIVYRFLFTRTDEDPTTFFNIRLGAENIKMNYTCEKSTDGGLTFTTIVSGGTVPPPYIGPRSIEDPVVGLGTTYEALIADAITTASTGETVFCGQADDPFFVDLGGIFDLGDAPRADGMPHDGVACYNTHTIALQIPINMLQKDGLNAADADDILDGDFVIGVWASASRPAMRTLNGDGTESVSGDWIQVSRLGMPLTNEAVIPIGAKDAWNGADPYSEDGAFYTYFYNPELALYMDDDLFGGAVPAFAPLRIQKASLGTYDFTNGADGLYPLKGSLAVEETALDEDLFGGLLLPAAGSPRSVDLLPIFHTGVPNLAPYQLATGKPDGNPLAAGKPFINNFLPNGGDMLRLNMAVPVTDRTDPAFSTEGLIQAAVLGLTDPLYATTDLEFIPNMDGFPNGRRLEDDVTRIELQAVAGVVLAAIGLWYDDYEVGVSPSPVTTDLLDVLTYTTGIESNDTSFKTSFPYVQTPWSGTGKCSGVVIDYEATLDCTAPSGLSATSITDVSATISWIPTPSAGFYNVIYKTAGGIPVSVTATVPGVALTGLTPCTNYLYKVVTKCGGNKISSGWFMFSTSGEDCRLGVATESVLGLFPNPAKDVININYFTNTENSVNMRIIDVTGKEHMNTSYSASNGINNFQIDVSALKAGVYYVQIKNGENEVTDKFVVTR
ncbi:MAG: DUF4331 family protein [Fimbriimonadaceae bacterium]|nr:DUF4331 family protein [Chitinophagales bacterium]